MKQKVKILMIEFLTHNIKRFIVEKPENYKFIQGQATEISINKSNWEDKKRPFTFTSLNKDLVLEFMIKRYIEHGGVTNELHKLKSGDELILRDVWGTINYKGPGFFIAGGTGINPFIAIFRQLQEENKLGDNKLIFSNKTSEDIILEKELKNMFKDKLILTLTEEKKENYRYGRINEEFLKKYITDFNQNFYICGPRKFTRDIKEILEKLEIKSIIIEQ